LKDKNGEFGSIQIQEIQMVNSKDSNSKDSNSTNAFESLESKINK
jgi:hypothetical protein